MKQGEPHIIFLTSTLDPHFAKRPKSFIERGYKVTTYAFERLRTKLLDADNIGLHILGSVESGGYHKRVVKFIKAFRKIFKEYKDENVVYYLLGNDVAMLAKPFINKPYIYEESDIQFARFKRPALNFFKWIDRKIIEDALVTAFTSRGFKQYHFGNETPSNIAYLENKLEPTILSFTPIEKQPIGKKIKVGFVGYVRYESLYQLCKIMLSEFPQFELHLYGSVNAGDKHLFEELNEFTKCTLHGRFESPVDLPGIYQNLDLLLAPYDYRDPNILFAEPNKLYESIYFNTPILVSETTFLAKRVKELGIGYAVDPFSAESVREFFSNLTPEKLQKKTDEMKKIDKSSAVEEFSDFFNLFKTRFVELGKIE